MLSYVRRVDFVTDNYVHRTAETTLSQHPIIGYCNWSFSQKSHISEQQLEKALHRFSSRFIPYYVRLFNEAPQVLLEDFIHMHNISNNEIENIYMQTKIKSGMRVSRNFFNAEVGGKTVAKAV